MIITESLRSVIEIEHLFCRLSLLSEEDARVIQLIEVCAIASMTQITLTWNAIQYTVCPILIDLREYIINIIKNILNKN